MFIYRQSVRILENKNEVLVKYLTLKYTYKYQVLHLCRLVVHFLTPVIGINYISSRRGWKNDS